MRGWRATLAMAIGLVASLAAARESHGKRALVTFAEPADIIAAEGVFTRLAAEKGVAAAIRATSAQDAQIFAPEPMRVVDYANRPQPAQPSTQSHTQQLWMSCDGSYGVTYGVWERPRAPSWSATVWHRQKGGGYKWVLSESGSLAAAPPETDMIAAKVADCPTRRTHDQPAVGAAPTDHPTAIDYTTHQADDGTMAWATTLAADGTRSFSLQLKQDGTMREVLHANLTQTGG